MVNQYRNFRHCNWDTAKDQQIAQAQALYNSASQVDAIAKSLDYISLPSRLVESRSEFLSACSLAEKHKDYHGACRGSC